MRKHTILILAILTLLAVAAPATAKPPNCDDPTSHPSCGGPDEGPMLAGTTCVEFADNSYLVNQLTNDFDFTITPTTPNAACMDVSNVAATGVWSIDFEVTAGSLRELIISVRDSAAPGDLCDEARLRFTQSGVVTLNPGTTDHVNACGTRYAEIVNGIYYGDTNEAVQSPLAFLVWTRGSKDLTVDIQVDYPNG